MSRDVHYVNSNIMLYCAGSDHAVTEESMYHIALVTVIEQTGVVPLFHGTLQITINGVRISSKGNYIYCTKLPPQICSSQSQCYNKITLLSHQVSSTVHLSN
jgi:hypothetical protein